MKHTTRQLGALLLAATLAHAGDDPITVCSEKNLAINDLDSAEVSINVSHNEDVLLDQLTIDLAIDHPWVGDLTVTVEKDGTSATLFSRVGSAAYPFACGGDNIDATFTDDADTTPDSLCSPTADPMLTGDLKPASPLSVFHGIDPTGVWTITIEDEGQYDTGFVDRACISFTTLPGACVADADGNGTVDINDVAYVIFRLGNTGAPGKTDGDADNSGTVDVNDISFVIFRLGGC